MMASGELNQVDFVIIAPLEEEREAVLRRLPSARKLPPFDEDVHVYYEAWLPTKAPSGRGGEYRIIVCSPLRMGRVEANSLASHALRKFTPRYVLLVGIAGGIQGEAELGDVLIAEQVVDYELQKITEAGARPRYRAYDPERRLFARAQHLDDWEAGIVVGRPVAGIPKRRVGPVASGDKVMAHGPALVALRDDWPKLIGVEMEAGGVHVAAQAAVPSCGMLMVRGVSDLADGEKDTSHVRAWRSYACDAAAAFAIALLKEGPVSPLRRESNSREAQVASDSSSASVGEKPAHRQLPFTRNPRFLGRKDLLAKIHDVLFTESDTPAFIALTGLRGVGKTQLALEYAYSHFDDHSAYHDVLWIRGSSEELLRSDFAGLADVLSLSEQHRADPGQRINGVRNWLEKNPRWLLIIDGADDAKASSWLSSLLPARRGGHVLVTSTNPNWRALGHVLAVYVLPPEEAVALLVSRSGQPRTSATTHLAEMLGRLPLALVQAASYVERTGMSWEKYIQLLVQREHELLARPVLDDYPATVATVWILSFERIQKESSAAAVLLCLGAFLAPVQFPVEMFVNRENLELPEELRRLQPLSDPLSIQEAVAALRAYSLAHVWEGYFWIHPLVQTMLRHHLGSERAEWAMLAVEVVRQCFRYSAYDHRTWSQSSLFFPHAWASIEHAVAASVAPMAVAELGCRLGAYCQTHVSPVLAVHVLRRIDKFCAASARGSQEGRIAIYELRIQHARALSSIGEGSSALALLDGLRKELSQGQLQISDSSAYAALLIERGNVLMADGRYADALESGQEALGQLIDGVDDPNRPLVASANGLVGLALVELARFSEGKDHLEKALAALPSGDSLGSMNWAILQHNLGLALQDLGDVSGAEQAYRRSIERLELLLGPYHPQTGRCRCQLGSLLMQRGEFRAARQELRKAYWAARSLPTRLNLDLSHAMRNLCHAFLCPGYWKRARILAASALEINLQMFSEKHPETIHAYGLLARAFHGSQENDSARSFFEKACTLTEELYGPAHPETASLYHNFGAFLVDAEDLEAGRKYLEKALNIDEQVYGKEHFEVATDLDSLSQVYLLQREWELALPLLERALTIREKQFGPTSARALLSVKAAARVLAEQGAWPMSSRFHKILVTAIERDPDSNSVQLCAALHEYASVLIESGNTKLARSAVEQAVALIKSSDEIPSELRVAVHMQQDRLDAQRGRTIAEVAPDGAADQAEHRAAMHRGQGLALAARHDFDGAVRELTVALRLLDNPTEPESVLLSNTLIDLGAVETAARLLPEAQKHLERALDMTLRLRAESHATAGTACRRLGELHRTLHEHERSRDYFQRAYSTWLRVFGPSHPQVGSILVDLGGAEIQTGNLASAESHLAAAEALLTKETEESEDASTEDIRRNLPPALARLRILQGRLVEAEKILTKALECSPSDDSQGHWVNIVLGLKELSDAYQVRGQLLQATRFLERAATLLDAHLAQEPLLPQLGARLYQSIALLHRQRGQRKESRDAMAKAYDRLQQTPAEVRDPSLVAQVALGYANYLRFDNQLVLAKRVLVEALDSQSSSQGAESKDDAKLSTAIHGLLGEVLLNLRQEGDAIVYLERALEAAGRDPRLLQGEQMDPDLFAELYCNTGLCLLRLNRDLERATDYLRQSLRLETTRYGDGHQRTALAALELARGLRQIHQMKEARQLAHQARQIFRRAGPANLARASEELFRQLRDTFVVSKKSKKAKRR